MTLTITPQMLANTEPPLTAAQSLEALEYHVKALEAASAFMKKRDRDAAQLLDFYWDDAAGDLLGTWKMKCWLEENQQLSWQVIVKLIELAGARALKEGESQYKAKVAARKNLEARLWVQEMWARREDKSISRAKFAAQIAPQLGGKFTTKGGSPLRISARTIEARWLKDAA